MSNRPAKEIIDPKKALEIGKNLVFDEKKYSEAITYFERTIELQPKYIDAWMRKGRALISIGGSRWKEALACFERAIQLTQDRGVENWMRESYSADAWYEKGGLLSKMGKPEEAAKYLKEAIKLAKKRKKKAPYNLWYGLGCEFLVLGDPRKAQECFREALDIIDYQIRNFAYGYQDREWLVENINRCSESYNKFLESFSKGAVLGSQGKDQEALEHFDRAISASYGSPATAVIGRGMGAWVNRGITLIRLKRLEEALECFERTTQRFPCNAEAWLRKGELLNRSGRDENALESFDRAIQLDPALAKAWIGKAIVLTNLRKGQEALMCIDRAIQLDPADAGILKTKEMIQQALKKG